MLTGLVMVFLQNCPESESFCLESQMTEPNIFLYYPPCQLKLSMNYSLFGFFLPVRIFIAQLLSGDFSSVRLLVVLRKVRLGYSWFEFSIPGNLSELLLRAGGGAGLSV